MFLCNKFTTKQGKTSAFPLRQKVWEHGWGLSDVDRVAYVALFLLGVFEDQLEILVLFNTNNDKNSSSKIVGLDILVMIVTTNNDDTITNNKIWQYQQEWEQ